MSVCLACLALFVKNSRIVNKNGRTLCQLVSMQYLVCIVTRDHTIHNNICTLQILNLESRI